MRYENFFLLPNGSVLNAGRGGHWSWIASNMGGKYKQVLKPCSEQGSLEPIFKAGWWRGVASRDRGKTILSFEVAPHPSKQVVINRTIDTMVALGLRKDSVEGVEIETGVGGRIRTSIYEISELLEHSFLGMVDLLLEKGLSPQEVVVFLEKT